MTARVATGLTAHDTSMLPSSGVLTGMSKWTVSGTTLAGQKTRANGCDFYTFRDGLVVKKDSYWKIVER
jgi:hypothetical protein